MRLQPAERRLDLVLHADILLQHLLLDIDRLLGEHALGHQLAAQRVQRMQQADREGRARAEAGARRQVAVMVDLDAVVDLQPFQHAADRRMGDLAGSCTCSIFDQTMRLRKSKNGGR